MRRQYILKFNSVVLHRVKEVRIETTKIKTLNDGVVQTAFIHIYIYLTFRSFSVLLLPFRKLTEDKKQVRNLYTTTTSKNPYLIKVGSYPGYHYKPPVNRVLSLFQRPGTVTQ